MNLEEGLAGTEERLLHEADTLGQMLERLRGRISPVLIGGPGWERLIDRARDLPATLAAFPFGFELPLHEQAPNADLGVSLIGGSRSAAFFEERSRSRDATLSTAGIGRLLDEMGPDDSPLRRVAGKKMLLEYDIDRTPGSAHPEPGLSPLPRQQDAHRRRPALRRRACHARRDFPRRRPDTAQR